MDQVPLVTSSTTIPLDRFWNSVQLYHKRPHLVNRKLATSTQVLFCKLELKNDEIKLISDIFTREALLYEFRKLSHLKSINPRFILSIIENYDKKAIINETNWDLFSQSFDGIFISIAILMGRKNAVLECPEIVIFDKKNKTATFFAVQEQNQAAIAPQFPYHAQLTLEGNLKIVLNSFEDADTAGAEWLADKLFPKLLKWSENDLDNENSIKSLALISSEHYYKLYNELKSKYGKDLCDLWPQKAKTDPQKYVYEEMAIATYLICLWRHLGATNITFVDCGCGNGLLAYILTREGYKGWGLDVRQRLIWESFGVDLRVETVTPSSIFPEATWVIGNHSDELTPWIPVIAAKSSPLTNFFVLPCCTYDFSGQKYVRKNTLKSQYADYLDYVRDISDNCGFMTSVDRLKIPSTRRICLVGIRDLGPSSNMNEIHSQIDQFVGRHLTNSQGFVARNPIERVRNCTQLDKNLIERIVKLCVGALLSTQVFIKKPNGDDWNQGDSLDFSGLAQNIGSQDLKLLKNECGGLQTLLKNHGYIFFVRGGVVKLRPPLSLVESCKYRDKPCWFYKNHPDGCFFTDETCAYKH